MFDLVIEELDITGLNFGIATIREKVSPSIATANMKIAVGRIGANGFSSETIDWHQRVPLGWMPQVMTGIIDWLFEAVINGCISFLNGAARCKLISRIPFDRYEIVPVD